MVTSKSKKNNQKYIIVAVGLALATAGYFGYKSMLTSPDINKVTTGEDGFKGGKLMSSAKPRTTSKPPVQSKQPSKSASPVFKSPVPSYRPSTAPSYRPSAVPSYRPSAAPSKQPAYSAAPIYQQSP